MKKMTENKIIIEKLLEQRASLVETVLDTNTDTNTFLHCVDEIKRIDNFIREINV